MSDVVPAPAVPAASLVLVRDGTAGLEVLVVVRHRSTAFAPGATVFPGGKLAPDDHPDAPLALAPRAAGMPEGPAFRVAALRETFEECGILLAFAGPGERFLEATAMLSWNDERKRLARGELSFLAFLAARQLTPALDRLVPFAHWITPEGRPLRFDTWFFVVEAPVGQIASHDGSELTQALWVTPQAALAHGAAGRWSLMLPTRLNLMRLAQSTSAAAALAAAARRPVVTVLPWTERRPGGLVRCIPADAGYGITEVPVDEAEATRKGDTP